MRNLNSVSSQPIDIDCENTLYLNRCILTVKRESDENDGVCCGNVLLQKLIMTTERMQKIEIRGNPIDSDLCSGDFENVVVGYLTDMVWVDTVNGLCMFANVQINELPTQNMTVKVTPLTLHHLVEKDAYAFIGFYMLPLTRNFDVVGEIDIAKVYQKMMLNGCLAIHFPNTGDKNSSAASHGGMNIYNRDVHERLKATYNALMPKLSTTPQDGNTVIERVVTIQPRNPAIKYPLVNVTNWVNENGTDCVNISVVVNVNLPDGT